MMILDILYYGLPRVMDFVPMNVAYKFEVRDNIGYLELKNVAISIYHEFGTKAHLKITHDENGKTKVTVESNTLFYQDALDTIISYMEEVGVDFNCKCC